MISSTEKEIYFRQFTIGQLAERWAELRRAHLGHFDKDLKRKEAAKEKWPYEERGISWHLWLWGWSVSLDDANRPRLYRRPPHGFPVRNGVIKASKIFKGREACDMVPADKREGM